MAEEKVEAVNVVEDDKKRTIDQVDAAGEAEESKTAETKAEETVADDKPVESKKEKKHRKKRRTQYDDEVPKEKSEDEKEDAEDEDDDYDDANDDLLDLDDEEEDDLAEIDTANIIAGGRRTRGKIVDFNKAAEKLKEEGKDEEEEGEDGEYTEKN